MGTLINTCRSKSGDIKITQNKLKEKAIFCFSLPLRRLNLHVSFRVLFYVYFEAGDNYASHVKFESQKALWFL